MPSETINIEKLYQDRLWVIQAFTMGRDSVDGWEAAVRAYIQQMNSNERYLVYDLLNVEHLGFTTYMRHRATALAKDNPEATGHVAVVIPLNTILRHFFEPFIQFTGSQIQPHLKVKFFGDRSKAVEWVASILPLEAPISGSIE